MDGSLSLLIPFCPFKQKRLITLFILFLFCCCLLIRSFNDFFLFILVFDLIVGTRMFDMLVSLQVL